MNPTDEQVRTFWGWCGFRKYEDKTGHWEGCYYWHNPTDTPDWGATWLPPIDLNSLFRWAVPKLKGVMGGRRLEEIHLCPSEDGWLCELDMVLMEYSEYVAEKCKVEYARDYPALDPAMALFWAIWGVIQRCPFRSWSCLRENML